MPVPPEFSFQRFLTAKQSVDDRALNRVVWDQMVSELRRDEASEELQVLELGAGIGTMFQRLVNWGALESCKYTAIDLNPENILSAKSHLAEWGKRFGWRIVAEDWGLKFQRDSQHLELRLEAIDLYDFLVREDSNQSRWDLVVAHAFLDLIDIPRTLPRLFSLLREGGMFYFTLNFDGVTIFESFLDADFEEQVISLYHRSMDQRVVNGHPSGDSLTGRKLFNYLSNFGGEILAASASDWVVYARKGDYPSDEAYFLHYIIHTIERELSDHPELDKKQFLSWIQTRHGQVERGELTFIAHQYDFFGRVQGAE